MSGSRPGAQGDSRQAEDLRKLSPRQRAVLVLRYFDDLTVADIRLRLRGISVGTVKSHARDALGRMRIQ